MYFLNSEMCIWSNSILNSNWNIWKKNRLNKPPRFDSFENLNFKIETYGQICMMLKGGSELIIHINQYSLMIDNANGEYGKEKTARQKSRK